MIFVTWDLIDFGKKERISVFVLESDVKFLRILVQSQKISRPTALSENFESPTRN